VTVFSITSAIAERATAWEASGFHKVPADQLIAATALAHKLRRVYDDRRIRQWGRVPMLWLTLRG
jgi:PIN domain nuclease of toxin-antitoxin system